MARINKRSLTMSVSGTERFAEVTVFKITSDDGDNDFVTFSDAAAGGGRQYTLEFTSAQDPLAGSLWDLIWTSPGSTVACIMRPFGNTTPTVLQPHYTFNATVKEPNGDFLGGEADASVTGVQTIECEWPLDAKPIKKTA